MPIRSAPQPPFSTELLADLHADNVAPEICEQLWPQIRRDPEALRFLRSLDDVTAELRALGRDPYILHPMPGAVAARLDGLLDALARGDAPADPVATVHRLPFARPPDNESVTPPSTRPMPTVPDPAATEPPRLDERRSRRLRWITAAAAAVAVLAGGLVALDTLRGGWDTTPNALPFKDSGAPTAVPLDDDSSTAVLLSAMGRTDITGPLAGPGALTGCLTANGLDRTVLGSMNVTFHGRPGVLILLTGPKPPKITALVVGTGCGPGNPDPITIRDIG
ncbi:hypothetical protein GZH49_33335 [Nocardia terpenica]|uniref:hypothetical protein n=1 Tax=Nocardia terpenica TaxID=455432 RepID=UPI002FE38BCB